MTTVRVPSLSLVVLVGTTGSGKSTFAARHFRPTEVLSSDAFRAMVGDDENDQTVTAEAFEALHAVAAQRLKLGHLTVVDATSVQADARRPLVALARQYHVLPVAVVLDVPEAVCIARNSTRPDRDFGPRVVKRQSATLRHSMGRLEREGFRRVFVLRGVDDIEAAEVVREPAWTDKSDLAGPFDIIGDIHGCHEELASLLDLLGYAVTGDNVRKHPDGRTAVFLGDLVDRGPGSPAVMRTVMAMAQAGSALCVPGNHEAKLVRALRGRDVKVTHGLAATLAQLADEPEEFRTQVAAFLDGLVSHFVLDGGRLVVAHAGLPEEMHGRASAAVRAFAMYGETTGETDEFGLPVRYPWAQDYRGKAAVVYGHTPVPEPAWVNNTICIDTGCVYGGRLTALRYPERELVSVAAARVHYEPTRPLNPPGAPPAPAYPSATQSAPAHTPPTPTAPAFTAPTPTAPTPTAPTPTAPTPTAPAPAASAPTAPARTAGQDVGHLLAVEDVLGTRGVETRLRGRVSVPEGGAAAALEVMTRYAADPRWLIYLPPTMAPVPASSLPGLLEHPADALAEYRRQGLARVVCEEKHMGSRAVVLACRTPGVALDWFGIEADGLVFTRTGRPFFTSPGPSGALGDALLGRVRGALDAAGVWAEAGDWVALDCELMPWSLKAEGLLIGQYAAVGAAARAGLAAAAGVLGQALDRGVDVAALRERTDQRRQTADAFTAAYRPYAWPVSSVDDLRLAPFQVLAGASGTCFDREQTWHLRVAERLAAADPLFVPTRHLVADLADPGAEQAVVAWWDELTGPGGEGMVVKPPAPVTRGRRGTVQPGVKCRGQEYLRIIYGPEYTLGGNLARLRERNLGRKRSLAATEFALGVEALERFVRREPLFRVHECVFAILALDSEPVDPRL